MTASYQRWDAGIYPQVNPDLSTARVIDDSTEKIAYIFCAEESDTITDLYVIYGTRTGTPPTFRISLQALDGSGFPDGTILGGGSPASVTFTPPADTTWNGLGRWFTLSNSIAITRGTLYAIVIDYSSGTINGSNCSSFRTEATNCHFNRDGIPYLGLNLASSWNKAAVGMFAYKSATATYGFPLGVPSSTQAATNGHRVAAKLTVPASWCSTYKVRGLNWRGTSAASADYKIGIWDAAGAVIQDATFDADAVFIPGNASRGHYSYFDESSLTALNAGTAYYFGIERTTQTVDMSYWPLLEAGNRTAFPFDTGVAMSTWNGSAWTDVTTQLPFLQLLLADVTAPAGGGGGIIAPSRIIQNIGTY